MNSGAPVVVGFDGSAPARRAIAWAASMAASLGRPLHIVHAVGLLEHGGVAGVPPADGDEAVAVAREAGLGAEAVTWSVIDGDPCSAMLRTARGPDGAAFLVVGSRGAGGHTGTLIGSTSLELAEHSPVPVVIVPPGAGPNRSAHHDDRAGGMA